MRLLVFYALQFTVLLCSLSASAAKNLVIITGATGALGQALSRLYARTGDVVYAGCRDISRGRQIFDSNDFSHNIHCFCCNFEDDQLRSNHLFEDIMSNLQQYSKYVLINNAGVCLQGSSESTLRLSLLVNTIKPLQLSEKIIQLCSGRTSSRCEVVNISSGDGELSYLHSSLQDRLHRLRSIEECYDLAQKMPLEFDSSMEYAFGSTPMYSVSKALLNIGTKLLNMKVKCGSVDQKVNVYSLCPGNFVSPMSSIEEISNACSAEDAAQFILSVTQQSFIQGGYFYRRGTDGKLWW